MWALPVLLAHLVGAGMEPALVQILTSAREHNHQLGISRAQLLEQEAAVDAALSALTPAVHASGSYTRNQYSATFALPDNLLGVGPINKTTTLTIQPYNSWQGQLSLDVPVFSVVNLYRRSEAARALDAAQGGTRATEAEVLLSTARAYYQVVAAQGVVRAAQTALSAAKDNLQVAQAREAAGTANALTVARARLDAATAQQTLTTAQETLAISRRNLETLSGAPVPATLPPPAPGPATIADEATYVAKARERRPEVAQAQAALAQAESGLREAWGQLVPVLAASAQERYTNAPGFITSDTSWLLEGTATWTGDPVGTPAAIRRARAAIEEQQERAAQVDDTVRDDVHTAWLDVGADRSRLEAATAGAASSAEALAVAREQFGAGAGTSLDVSQALRDSFNAEANRVQAEADLAAALVALTKASGEPLLEPAAGAPP